MRAIKPDEECLAASEIAERFADETGHELHPTNVGQAAKRLGLDYQEIEVEAPPGVPGGWVWQRRYSTQDMPRIFEQLAELVAQRAAYQKR